MKLKLHHPLILLLLIVLILTILKTQAQDGDDKRGMKIANKKLALVIGNGNYISKGDYLANPLNDAAAMTTALQELGFTVLTHKNLSQRNLKKAINNFGEQLKNYDAGLFFYAGHGMQVKGINYLVPVDVELKNETDVELDCVRADRVLLKMEAAKTDINIVVLDACRDNPFERSWRSGKGKGLAFMDAPVGSLIAYATQHGRTASDGNGRNGLYTSAILEHIHTPNLSVLEIFMRVRTTVKKRSNNEQIPTETNTTTKNFYFKYELREPPPLPPIPEPGIPPIPIPEPEPPPRISPLDLIPYNMVDVEGGTFMMGCASEQGDDCESDKNPAHQVTLSDFSISKYEVTQAQWKEIMDENPSYFKTCDECPVERLSWNDTQEFIKRLNQKTGKNYRLPTEAEWEYAARGGSSSRGYKYAGSNDLNRVAWHDYNAEVKTQKVGTKNANELGLYDMSGNVSEWCSDRYEDYSAAAQTNPTGPSSGSSRVLRGSSWRSKSAGVVKRFKDFQSNKYTYYGFRLAHNN